MSINSVSSSSLVSALYSPSQPESKEATKAGRDVRNDGDKDDGSKAQAPAKPTANTLGQTVGTIINTTA